jgi:hypothetical protein
MKGIQIIKNKVESLSIANMIVCVELLWNLQKATRTDKSLARNSC